MYDWVAWLKLKREKVSYIELQVRFWSWLTIKGRNMKVIPKMFGDRNSVGRNPRSWDAFLFIVWFFNLQRNIIYRKSWLKVITKVNELKNKAWRTWNILSKIIPIKSQWQDEKISSSITTHSLWLEPGHERGIWACPSKLLGILALDSRFLWNYILTTLQSGDYNCTSSWMESEFTKTSAKYGEHF